MLAYGVMILNHYRLCYQHPRSSLPLNLLELFRSTQQIGAFQVRVQRSLGQVLSTSLSPLSFWLHWAAWMQQMLGQWTTTPPAICQTPGLLPLQDATGYWGWQEARVIQAMALEAAHQLVERLPLDSVVMIEGLLGLQEALVEDSSRIDPCDFESVPLGLPLLPETLPQIQVAVEDLDPALKRLPQLHIQFCPQAPMPMKAPVVLSHWLWALMQQFGPEASYGGLFLIQAMDQADWRGAIALRGSEILAALPSRLPPSGQALRALARRMRLLCQAQVRWTEQDLEQAVVRCGQESLWSLESLALSQPLEIPTLAGHDAPLYGRGEVQELHLQVAPGLWCDRLIQCYGDSVQQDLLTFSRLAQQVLRIDPTQAPLAARMAVLTAHQFWLGRETVYSIREVLTRVEAEDKIQSLESNAMRRLAFFQDWAAMVSQLQALGWSVQAQTLDPWKTAATNDLSWLEVSISIQVNPWASPQPFKSSQTMGGNSVSRPRAPQRLKRMDRISRQALERALAARGMSQARLARSLDLDRSTINRWINGSRPIHPRYRPALWDLLGADLILDDG